VLADLGARILHNRRLVRAPIWLYRARLGALLGPRLLMLEHTGRSSGRRRYVVLETIERPRDNCFVVASGFGTTAQWFRNICADPQVRVWTGSNGPARATARVLDQAETDRTLADYRMRHPRYWDRFRPVLEQTLGQAIGERDIPLPVVELRLQS
jgi:deazaflavin-dependent oxidoreductase (nitroreductase family)